MKFFRKPRARFLFVYPLAVWLFVTAHTTESSLLAGAILAALGELVRCWANGYVGHVKVNWTESWRGDPKIGSLITGGPYAYVRHPLYFGTMLIGLGFCVIAGNLFFAAVACAAFFAIYSKKMANEEATLAHECGDEYAAYQRAVPRLWPIHRPYAPRRGTWSWQGMVASRELKTCVWVAVMVLLLYFREEFLQERETLLQEHPLKRAVLLGVLVGLIAADGIAELQRRRRRAACLQTS